MKNLLKLSAALCMSLMISVASVMASAKMEIPLGETVSLQAQILQGGTDYKWAASKDGEIITVQSGSFFNHTFDQQGEYIVNLSAEDRGGETHFTRINIMVGDRYSNPPTNSSGDGSNLNTPLVNVDAQTLPLINSEKEVHVLGDEGTVVFDLATHPDILEYRVDRNIFLDSDGNGIANDDIDNASDRSYLVGGIYKTTYDTTEANKVTAEITAVTTTGQKLKRQIEIIFDSFVVTDETVQASLDTLPSLSEDGKIYLYGTKGSVAFYPRLTKGEILEYRIDKNIFVDSDQDGDPANDIDNKTDPSFKNGDVWLTEYQDSGQQIIAQLIVVGNGGVGSRLQREIIFTTRPEPEVSGNQNTGDSIALEADKEFVQIGDPIAFSVEGLSQSLDQYEFEWDYNGDAEVDQTTEGVNTVSFIYEQAGIQNVTVRVVDKSENEAVFTKEILVKEIDITQAVFDFEIDGKTVRFNNNSTTAANLSNQSLSYAWSFGDTNEENYEAQRDQLTSSSPLYTYVEPGTYLVTLTVTDSDQVTSTISKELVIEGLEGEVIASENENTNQANTEGGSFIGKLFKVILYIILIILLLVLLIVGGLLGFLKIQHPDLVFGELIDELKIKLLSMMGIHEDMVYHDDESGENLQDPTIPQESVDTIIPPAPKPDIAETPEVAPEPVETPVAEPDLSQANGPTPEWLKPKPETTPPVTEKADVIEAEVVEETPVETAAPEAPVAPEPMTVPQENPFEKPIEPSSPLNETKVEPVPMPEPAPEVKPDVQIETPASVEPPVETPAEELSPAAEPVPIQEIPTPNSEIQPEEVPEPSPVPEDTPTPLPEVAKPDVVEAPVEKPSVVGEEKLMDEKKVGATKKPDEMKAPMPLAKSEANSETGATKSRRRRRPRSRNRSRQNGEGGNKPQNPQGENTASMPNTSEKQPSPRPPRPPRSERPRVDGKKTENSSKPEPKKTESPTAEAPKPITPPDGDLSKNDGPVPDWLKQ